MSLPPSARATLRAATSADHERVDAAFAGFGLGTREGYAAFLRAQAGALLLVEAGIDRADPAAVLPDWPERRRAHLLRADLTALGTETAPSADIPSFDSVEALLGAIYVVEGSRLGGRMLARSVPDDLPRAFLDGGDPARWRHLLEVIETTLTTEQQIATATEAARAVFTRFETSAREQAETTL